MPTRPRTRTRPSDWGRYGHAPSGLCATVGRGVDPEDFAAPAGKQRVWCASPGSRSAHRHPVSNARSSTVVSGSPGGAGEPCVVPPSERVEIRLRDEATTAIRPPARSSLWTGSGYTGRPWGLRWLPYSRVSPGLTRLYGEPQRGGWSLRLRHRAGVLPHPTARFACPACGKENLTLHALRGTRQTIARDLIDH